MFAIRAVQAEFGDCVILEYGTAAAPRYLLIDGGPDETFKRHLSMELKAIADAGRSLDLVMLSHVDNDHVIGLLDLFSLLRENQANGQPPFIRVGALWHNAFGEAIGGNLEPRLRAALARAGPATMAAAHAAILGIGEGHNLRIAANALQIGVNGGFPQSLVCVDDHPAPVVFGNLTLRIVGPTRANLTALREEWEEWLEEHEDELADPFVAANADQSIPNLSSIMVVAEAHGKQVLLTGDGRSDHLLDGLEQAGLLQNGALHVDVMKVAHHGSDRNATKTFFKKVTADTYLISANGKDGNPDTATLIWIVEAAKAQQRRITIHVTNKTVSTQKLIDEYPPGEYGYTLKTLQKTRHSLKLDLAP